MRTIVDDRMEVRSLDRPTAASTRVPADVAERVPSDIADGVRAGVRDMLPVTVAIAPFALVLGVASTHPLSTTSQA